MTMAFKVVMQSPLPLGDLVAEVTLDGAGSRWSSCKKDALTGAFRRRPSGSS